MNLNFKQWPKGEVRVQKPIGQWGSVSILGRGTVLALPQRSQTLGSRSVATAGWILGTAWTGGQLPSQVSKVPKLGAVWVQFTSVSCLFNIHGASDQAALLPCVHSSAHLWCISTAHTLQPQGSPGPRQSCRPRWPPPRRCAYPPWS